MKPLLSAINPEYFHRILGWQNKSYKLVGKLAAVDGFDLYNNLIYINAVFSSEPFGEPVDRTGTITGPFKFAIQRPWQPPSQQISLEQTIEKRVQYYLAQDQQLNLCWSGGIDSTAMVAGFLQHASDLDQLRIIYTPYSVYEHQTFFEYIKQQFPTLEMLDISGDVYIDNEFDGVMINGHGGDEFTASLDDSFFDTYGSDILQQPWKEFFYKQNSRTKFIEFCETFFLLAGRPINTVLEARWWFYSITKSQVFSIVDSTIAQNASTSAFFNCIEVEDYMWHNTDKIVVPGGGYNTYKQFLKDYIYKFDHNKDFCTNASKINSWQFIGYAHKKSFLLDRYWIAMLENSTRIHTPNLPLFSKLELEKTYGRELDYLFNYDY
jgi:hypothetical protein